MLGNNKGQFFLILALLFVVFFSILFSTSLSYDTLLKTRKSLEYNIYSENFENIKNEEGKIFTYFYYDPNMKNYVWNFTTYSRDRFELNGVEIKGLFLLAYYDTIVANQERILNVSFLNVVKTNITNINITFTYNNTSRNQTSLEDSNFFETYFGFNIPSDSSYNLILKYNDGENRTYNITVPLKIGKSKKIGFWAISLKAGDFLLKDDFQKVG